MLNRYNFISIFRLSPTRLEKNDYYSIQLLSRIIILYIYKMEEQVIFILFSYKKRDKFEHSFLQDERNSNDLLVTRQYLRIIKILVQVDKHL